MRLSLLGKLLFAFLSIILTVAVPVVFLNWRTSTREVQRFVSEQERDQFITEMTAYYRVYRSWTGLPKSVERDFPNGPPGGRPAFSVLDTHGVLQLPLGPFRPGDRLPPDQFQPRTPLLVDNVLVGEVVTDNHTFALSASEQALLTHINRNLFLAIGGACLLALLLGALLARTFVRPIQQLMQATKALAQGALGQQVAVQTKDEIGDLARAFNQMSQDLARSTQLRRQMTADIAHELRNPLTVVAGYIEGMRDGVLAATPARLTVIYNEIEHLQHLVEDLRTLSLADAGELGLQPQPTPPALLLERVADRYQHQATQQQVTLEVAAPDALPFLLVDEERMVQVLSNLVGNALRYTPAGGKIYLTAQTTGDNITLVVQDTGTGIAAADLPHIFERFYRADHARQGDDGSSGLGLAIVKSLVEAHGGGIHVASTVGQGSAFTISIPRCKM
ncbi:MAG: ATP-binding protein [Caldilineaceae bacterium]